MPINSVAPAVYKVLSHGDVRFYALRARYADAQREVVRLARPDSAARCGAQPCTSQLRSQGSPGNEAHGNK